MARTTGLSAGEAVLGLVVEQPDRGFALERRLAQRFAAARFAYSTAYSAVRRLQKDGFVRAIQADSGASEEEEVLYEATAEGVAHLREWVRAPTSTPALREELHARIALCEPRDLPRLIDIVHSEELACIAELDRVRKRMVGEQSEARSRPLEREPWSALMDRGVVHGEAAFWGGRATQLAQLRAYLEDLRAEAERRAINRHRRAHAQAQARDQAQARTRRAHAG